MTATELRAALRDLGLTQAEFARLTGDERETVNRKINGKRPVQQSDETIVRLARGESLEALLRELG